ncbi:MAG: penicillin-binding protein 1C [Kiritimatiellia bacterium]
MRHSLSARGARRLRTFLTAAAAALALGFLGLQAALLLVPFNETLYRTPPPALRITDREGRTLRVACAADERVAFPANGRGAGWRRLGQAVVAIEDKRFYRHRGVDGWAVLRALVQNIARARVHSGASTISTQVVRLMESRGPRGFRLKLGEAFRALQLERRFSKAEILSIYLNNAPFGGNRVGVRAASLTYFNREPEALSLAEAALLAGLPNAPSALRPDRHPARAEKRRAAVLNRLRACGSIDEPQLQAALREPVRCRTGGRSFEAPHFCDWLARRLPPGGGEWKSTLDSRLQALAEACVDRQAEKWRKKQVWGGAVVVLEVATGAIRAMVGSPDYDDRAHAGQVNGAAAPRSPGSALKPFLYAAAFDRGSAVPETVLPDAPIRFAGYEPVNFDKVWRGTVTCRQALDQSLNVPALWLLRSYGLSSFLDYLEKAGLNAREPGLPAPGLGVIIGDCRVRLADLANAYAALARLGVWKPLRGLEDRPVEAGERLASPEACWLVADILSQDSRQMAFFGNCGDVVLPKVAWKTGTSSGFRDAWCVAWSPDYVVAVWVGNPDGRGSAGLTGQSAAVPLAAELFRNLVPAGRGGWYAPPPGLVRRAYCPASGQPPNTDCPVGMTGWAVAGVSDPAPCGVHRRVPFSILNGRRLSLEEAGAEPAEWRVIEARPGEAQEWLRRTGGSGLVASGSVQSELAIAQPVQGRTYRRPAGRHGAHEGLPLRVRQAEGGTVYWFVNGVFFKSAGAGQTVLLPWPESGALTVSCADAQGRGDRVDVTVE